MDPVFGRDLKGEARAEMLRRIALAAGKLIATFTSVWRQESPGVWRIVFDKGNEVCDCAKAP